MFHVAQLDRNPNIWPVVLVRDPAQIQFIYLMLRLTLRPRSTLNNGVSESLVFSSLLVFTPAQLESEREKQGKWLMKHFSLSQVHALLLRAMARWNRHDLFQLGLDVFRKEPGLVVQ